jgi:catechol 2,3-dioxygenase-like lactoylglutathione lyase family enzyme
MAYTTVVTSDLDRAKQIYLGAFGGRLLYEGESALTGTLNAYVGLGECVIELARPTRKGTFASADLEANGEMHHAVTFKVSDLDKAQAYVASKGLRSTATDGETTLYDPATTKGALFRLTTWSVPNDPRD